MRSVDHCSRRFDFLRLHRQAWQHKLIRKPRSMDAGHIDKHVMDLLIALCGSLFKEYGIAFKVRKEHEAIYFEVPAMATWLHEVKDKTGQVLESHLTLPNPEAQIIRLVCKEGRVSCAASQYDLFAKDLAMLAKLDAELAAGNDEGNQNVTIEAPTPFGQVVPKRRKKRAA